MKAGRLGDLGESRLHQPSPDAGSVQGSEVRGSGDDEAPRDREPSVDELTEIGALASGQGDIDPADLTEREDGVLEHGIHDLQRVWAAT